MITIQMVLVINAIKTLMLMEYLMLVITVLSFLIAIRGNQMRLWLNAPLN